MTSIIPGIALLLLLGISVEVVPAQSYKITGSIPIGGTGHGDYLIVDPDNRRLYVSHNSEVAVINVDTQEIPGKIAVDGFSHGIAIDNDHRLGFITDGGSKTSNVKSPEQVVTFDLNTLKRTATTAVGDDPDAIVYDAPTTRVFAFNGDPMQASAIAAKTSEMETLIELGGNPEFSTSDGIGNVYVNIKNKSEIARIDSKTLKVTAHWPFSSNRDGTLTVVRQNTKEEYTVLQTVKTEVGARTMALDTKTHKVYLPSAEFAPKPAGSNYPSVVPGSFKVLVLQPE